MADARVRTAAALTPIERELLLGGIERRHGLGYFVWELAGRVVWSDGMFELLGRPAEDRVLDRDAFFAAVHPDDRERVRTVWAAAGRGEPIEPTEYRLVDARGRVRFVRGTHDPIVDETGAVVGYVGDIVDLTGQREAAIDAEITLMAVEEAPTGTFVYTPATGRRYWSRGLYRILGLEPGTAPEFDSAVELTHPDDRQRLRAWYATLTEVGHAAPARFRVVRPDGSVRFTENYAARIRLGVDGHDHLVGTTLDITERVELEEHLRHAAKMEAIGTLAAGVAHDFNNYLTVISGAVEVLSRATTSGQRAADMVRHAVKQCTLLTRQLLAFARKQPSSPSTVDLVAVVQSAGAILGRILGEQVTLDLELPDQPVPVEADPGHLEHVIINLAANARDAMPSGGHLRLTLARIDIAPGHTPPIANLAPGAWARLEVIDTGCGIAPEDLPRVFEPYFTTKEAGQGTGLGLASVYGTIRQNHGRVMVSSEAGQGTRFTIYLPLRSQVAADQPSRVEAAPAGAGTILVVEDMRELRAIVARGLTAAGFRALTAADADEALAVIDGGEQVDVVVSDVVMPGRSGVELAAELRRRRPELPVVLMTGYAERAILTETDREVVAKPFAIDELLRALARARGR